MEKRSSIRDNFVQEVATEIVDMINAGEESGWMHWDSPLGRVPFNPTTGKIYGGANLINLMMQMRKRCINDSRFLGFGQAKKWDKTTGTHVKKGSAAFKVSIPIFREVPEGGEEDRELNELLDMTNMDDAPRKALVGFSVGNVFSAIDVENAPQPNVPPRRWKDNELVDKLIQASGAEVVHGNYDPHYSHKDGKIYMPNTDFFESEAVYTAVKLHEWYHWTGHPDRENRFQERHEPGADIDSLKAQEELRAQTFSCIASQMLGIPSIPMANHANYLSYYKEKLNDNPKEILKAANRAGAMLEVIMDVAQGMQPQKADWFLDKQSWPAISIDVPILMDASEYMETEWDRIVGDFCLEPDMEPAEIREVGLEIKARAVRENINLVGVQKFVQDNIQKLQPAEVGLSF